MSMPPPPPPLPPHPEIRYHPYEYDGGQQPAPSQYNAPPPPPRPPSAYDPSYYNSPPPASYNAAQPPSADYRVTSPMPAPRPQGTSNPAADLEGLAHMSLNPPTHGQSPLPQNGYLGNGFAGGFSGGFALSSSHGGTGNDDVMASISRVNSVGGHHYSAPPSASQVPLPRTPAPADAYPPLPTVKSLTDAAPTTPAGQIAWCRDAVYLIERSTPHAQSLSTRATSLLAALGPSNPEAVYLRACLAAPTNPRSAFRDFEASARGGCHIAWFRLGRDYEQFGDNQHAKECFDRGVRLNVVSCIYRMGMAHMLGQLGVTQDAVTAMNLLKRAADGATLYSPEPAYVYALILMTEFTPPAPYTLPPFALPQSPLLAAKPYLVKAGGLHFAPAQYKLAHAYEFATYPFSYDPLLSVEYYSKASQAGEREADMALSKWFLCGSEGAFERDEGLARVFAERAAGELASAMFAMGYYDEVGVGGPVNLDSARMWYQKAHEKGNSDAGDRLKALGAGGQGMGRSEHEKVMGATLVRTRTDAKMKAHNQGQPGPQRGGNDVVGQLRKSTLDVPPPMPAMPSMAAPPSMTPPSNQPPPQYNQPPPQFNQSPLQHNQQPPQQMPGRNRYSLADPGATPRPPSQPHSRPHSQSPSRPPTGRIPSGPLPQQPAQNYRPSPAPSASGGGRVPSGVANTSQPQSTGHPSKKPGPQTFAEMGFQGTKAEEEKCVVM